MKGFKIPHYPRRAQLGASPGDGNILVTTTAAGTVTLLVPTAFLYHLYCAEPGHGYSGPIPDAGPACHCQWTVDNVLALLTAHCAVSNAITLRSCTSVNENRVPRFPYPPQVRCEFHSNASQESEKCVAPSTIHSELTTTARPPKPAPFATRQVKYETMIKLWSLYSRTVWRRVCSDLRAGRRCSSFPMHDGCTWAVFYSSGFYFYSPWDSLLTNPQGFCNAGCEAAPSRSSARPAPRGFAIWAPKLVSLVIATVRTTDPLTMSSV